MTEAEALTRWCPFARVPTTAVNLPPDGSLHPAAVNRTPHGIPHPAAHCLASVCMAWRWRDTGRPTGDGDGDGEGDCGLAR